MLGCAVAGAVWFEIAKPAMPEGLNRIGLCSTKVGRTTRLGNVAHPAVIVELLYSGDV